MTDTVIRNVEKTIDTLIRRELDAICNKEIKANIGAFSSNGSSVIVKPGVSNKRSEFYQAAANKSK